MVDIRQYRGSKYQAGQGPGGHGRLGCTPLIKPATGKVQDHLAALGRILKRGQALPQGPLLRQRNPLSRGGATYYRVGGSDAGYERLDHLPWSQHRHWARWRHPRTSTAWAIRRSWHRGGTRLTFAASATAPDATPLLAHSEGPMTRQGKVQGNRRPFPMLGTGATGARNKAAPPTSVHDGPGCAHSHTAAVVAVGYASNMTPGLRGTLCMGTTVMRAL